MRRLLHSFLASAIALVLLLIASWLLFGAYRRVRTSLQLAGDTVTVQGVITEKVTETRSERRLPFSLRAYVVRYAFPAPPQGQMWSGEQTVTRRFFEQAGGQGDPVPVTFRRGDPTIQAVDPRLTFPAEAGWRLGAGLILLTLGLLMGVVAAGLTRRAS